MPPSSQSLQQVVGSVKYTTWVDMLRRLVPDGRTHRLAPLVAGMLQYATLLADDMDYEESVVQRLQEAAEAYDPEEASSLLLPLIDQLFADAGVSYQRTNARGRGYSIADEIIHEYMHWYDMPWES
ncbi:MAG: hypothetical protein IPJ94_22775 [Chloroflexi bacterium]|nr:hypothetical protein [Chloroflexota bacterium]